MFEKGTAGPMNGGTGTPTSEYAWKGCWLAMGKGTGGGYAVMLWFMGSAGGKGDAALESHDAESHDPEDVEFRLGMIWLSAHLACGLRPT